MADVKNEKLLKEEQTAHEASTAVEDPEASSDALESFLSREQKDKKAPKLSRSRKTSFLLIGAVLAVAILVTALVFLRRTPVTSDEETSSFADVTLSVGEDGMHEASVPTDKNGEIKQNGTGSLMRYVPADIKQIDIENEGGTFRITSTTPQGEATVYTIVGFEDYDIEGGIADAIASHCSELQFTQIVSAKAKLSKYGLDQPRAKATVTYSDDTTALIRIGDNAPGGAGAYVAFGSGSAVYLASTDTAADFLYSVNGLISPVITETVEDSDNAAFTSLTISGTRFSEPITLVPNTDEAVNASYLITSPRRMIADAIESSDIAGNIRGLYAESVACVNPSKAQLKSYGLDKPYASIKAVYPDTQIVLHSGKPDDNGIVHVYNPDKKIVFDIQLAAVCWAKTGLEALMPENPLNSSAAYIEQIDFTAGSTSFTLDVSSETSTVTDEDGVEQQVTDTSAFYNGKELNQQNFTVFFQNLNAIKNLGYSDNSGSGKVMSVTFHYTTGHTPDTLTVYGSSDNTYFLEFNGDRIGTVNKPYITKLIKGANDLIQGKTVEGL